MQYLNSIDCFEAKTNNFNELVFTLNVFRQMFQDDRTDLHVLKKNLFKLVDLIKKKYYAK